MKLRLVLVLLLFIASVGILIWLYTAATRKPQHPKSSPWEETLADLDACCRRKHVKSMQYDHFAGIAAGENRHEAARLFRAMAFAERLQEQNCASAIVRLGSDYTPPGKVVMFGGTTDSNLERSIAFERKTYAERHGLEIGRALNKGNRFAARVLIWASAGDLRNITLLEYCQEHAKRGSDNCTFAVCPVCGNLYSSEYLDYFCPFCLTDNQKFILFE